jgi:epoxyqueuosine reductase
LARNVGAVACGVADAGAVDADVSASLDAWIAAGCHADMSWIERHASLRRTTDSVLPGARSVIVCAFNYYPARRRNPSLPVIALYAYGDDYHDVVRRRLRDVAAAMKQRYGGEYRVCVDTAPLSERYWAQRAGVAAQGRNCLLSVDGYGTYILLGEILTTLHLDASSPTTVSPCPDGCRRCIDACPGGALRGDGTLDARRCLSFLTIENRAPSLSDDIRLCGQVYGCDICQRVCPRNARVAPTSIPEFSPSEAFLSLNLTQMLALDKDTFSCIFSRSAIRRAGLDGLLRNARALARQLIS